MARKGKPHLYLNLSWYVSVLALQLCLTLCDPLDCTPPGLSVHGILQARILEWVANHGRHQIFPTQGSNLFLIDIERRVLYH